MSTQSSRSVRALGLVVTCASLALAAAACAAFGGATDDEPGPGGAEAGSATEAGGSVDDGGRTRGDGSVPEDGSAPEDGDVPLDADGTRDGGKEAGAFCTSGFCDPFSGPRCGSLRGGLWTSEKNQPSPEGTVVLEPTGADCPLRARVTAGVGARPSQTAHSLAYYGTAVQDAVTVSFDITVSEVPEPNGSIELLRVGSTAGGNEPFVAYLTAINDAGQGRLQLSVQPEVDAVARETILNKVDVAPGTRMRGALRLDLVAKTASGTFESSKGPDLSVAYLVPTVPDLWAGIYFNYHTGTGSFLFHRLAMPR